MCGVNSKESIDVGKIYETSEKLEELASRFKSVMINWRKGHGGKEFF